MKYILKVNETKEELSGSTIVLPSVLMHDGEDVSIFNGDVNQEAVMFIQDGKLAIKKVKKVQPFILYNRNGSDSSISLYREGTLADTSVDYAVVSDYVEGQTYDDSSVEYTNVQLTTTGETEIATIPSNCALLMKSTQKVRWATSDSNYTRFVAWGGYLYAYGDVGSLDGFGEELDAYCYCYLFQNVSALKKAPELPATTLAPYCYAGIFSNCRVDAIELPATTLVEGCYSGMFGGCTTLKTAPKLTATTLAKNCYNGMFGTCYSLAKAPELPATTLAEGCYASMFSYCTGLTETPELPATTLAKECYKNMFGGCKTLTKVHELPATTLAEGCYASMFSYCTSLVESPVLNATTLAEGCYLSMFQNCSKLAKAPSILPSETLAASCYTGMFQSCTVLTDAPKLPATTLAEWCYASMFTNCTNLNYIKMMSINKPTDFNTFMWVSGVASTGTFVKNAAATWEKTGVSGIPTGWTVETATE